MPYSFDDYLPSVEELTVPELEVTSSVLRAGSIHFGKYCDDVSKEFMLCMSEEQDPRKCLNEGREVTKCGLEFFGKVKKHCYEEFTKYWQCIDHSGREMQFRYCRKPQRIFDKCVKENLGVERPPIGYFCKVRTHHTDRPRAELPKHDVPDPVPEAPPIPAEIDPRAKHMVNP